MPHLTNEQIARWKYDGFMSPFPLLDEAGLAEARAGVARFEDWIGGPINGHEQLKWRTMPHLLMPWAARLSCNPGVLDPVRDLLGPDLLLFTGTFFIKEPNSPTIAAWHQDLTYYGLAPKEVITVWIALSDASSHHVSLIGGDCVAAAVWHWRDLAGWSAASRKCSSQFYTKAVIRRETDGEGVCPIDNVRY